MAVRHTHQQEEQEHVEGHSDISRSFPDRKLNALDKSHNNEARQIIIPVLRSRPYILLSNCYRVGTSEYRTQFYFRWGGHRRFLENLIVTTPPTPQPPGCHNRLPSLTRVWLWMVIILNPRPPHPTQSGGWTHACLFQVNPVQPASFCWALRVVYVRNYVNKINTIYLVRHDSNARVGIWERANWLKNMYIGGSRCRPYACI